MMFWPIEIGVIFDDISFFKIFNFLFLYSRSFSILEY